MNVMCDGPWRTASLLWQPSLDLRGSKPATAIVPAALPGGAGVWVTRRF